MKRPMVVVNLLSFIFIFMLAQNLYIAFFIFAGASILFFMSKMNYIIIFALLITLLSYQTIDKKVDYYDSEPENLEVKGYLVCSQDVNEMILEVVEINSKKTVKYKILVKNDIEVPIKQYVFKKYLYSVNYKKNSYFKRNPNTFDYKKYLNSNGIVDVIKMSEMHLKEVGYKNQLNLKYVNSRNREYIKKRILSCFKNKEESAYFVIAILFGDKEGLSDETLDIFRKNGTAHVLAISGLHIGLLFGLLNKLLFFIKPKLRSWISLSILFGYIMLIGAPISALRAGAMLLFALLSIKYERKYDMLNVLSLISWIVIIINPLIIFNISYQLSFIAVLIIATFYQTVKTKLNTKKSLFWAVLLLPLAIQIGMLPIQTYYFNHISILSFLINIPTIILMTSVLYLSVLLLVSIFILPQAVGVVSILIHFILEIVQVMNISYHSFEILNFEITSPHISFVIITYISLISLTYRNRKKIITVFFTVLICYHFFLGIFTVDVYFFDIGQGDSILINQRFGQTILIDGGPPDENLYLKELLYKNGIGNIDDVIISHAHSDHLGGILDIANDIRFKNVYFKSPNQDDKLFRRLIRTASFGSTTALDRGDTLMLGDISFEIYGVSTGDNLNNNSLVAVANIFDTKLLLTGDIEESAELILIKNKELYDIDIMKVPHHGSQTSSTLEFLELTKPEVAVACLDRNYYGHPSLEVVNRYLENESKFYRTDNGCVKVTILPFNIYFIKQYK